MTIELVDVSAYQPAALDYRAILASGVVGAMVKLTDGVGSPDAGARAHCAGFRSFGLEAGGYHYLRARHGAPQDADEQARQFAASYRANGCTLVSAVDCELSGNADATPTEWAIAIGLYLRTSRLLLGWLPAIYSDPWEWSQLSSAMAGAEDRALLAQCPLWWSQYGVAEPSPPAPWSAPPLLWQWTDKGTVAGIPSAVDRSRSSRPIEALRRPPAVA